MSLTDKKLKYFRKDEKMATKEYAKAAEKVDCERMEHMFEEMSKDEAKHAKYLKEMLRLNEEYKEINKTKKRKRKGKNK